MLFDISSMKSNEFNLNRETSEIPISYKTGRLARSSQPQISVDAGDVIHDCGYSR